MVEKSHRPNFNLSCIIFQTWSLKVWEYASEKIPTKVTFEAFTTEKIAFFSRKIHGWNLSRHKRAIICKLIDIVCLSELNVVYC